MVICNTLETKGSILNGKNIMFHKNLTSQKVLIVEPGTQDN